MSAWHYTETASREQRLQRAVKKDRAAEEVKTAELI